MRRSSVKAIARCACKVLVCGVPILLSSTSPATAGAAERYSQMAPVESYLMERSEEIALARSAGPPSISRDATVMVLTRSGYETAVAGTNGFLCWVARSFSGPSDAPERWNPKIRAAECLNPQAARTVAPIVELRTAMILVGRTDAETIQGIKGAFSSKKIPTLEPGAVSYMMSKSSYLLDEGDHDMSHVMFFVPVRDGSDWAANAPGSPFIGGNYWYFTPGHEAQIADLPPMSVFITAVGTWSDGTPVTPHSM